MVNKPTTVGEGRRGSAFHGSLLNTSQSRPQSPCAFTVSGIEMPRILGADYLHGNEIEHIALILRLGHASEALA